MAINVAAITAILAAQDIPVVSIIDTDGTRQGVQVIYDASATQQQIAAGNALIAAYDGTTPMGYVDCTKVGAVPIAFITGAAALFFPQGYRIIVRSAQGLITPPTLSIGTNSPNYDNVTPATALGAVGLTATGAMRNVPLALTQVVTQNIGIFANVTVAAVAEAFIVRIDLKGDYEQR